MDKTCKNCKHWEHDEDEEYDGIGSYGDCNCSELLSFDLKRKKTNRGIFVETEYYPYLKNHRELDKEVHKEYRKWFQWLWLGTYENFGCVHWKENAKEN